jgi:glycosyltransferase involved in cell wall biosynthesis
VSRAPRVALFADTFHEVNGAALTCRRLEDFARRAALPLLSIHCGPRQALERGEAVWTLQLRRSRLSAPIDAGLSFDPLFFRHRGRVLEALREFAPDVVHVTSPGDMGILGMWTAHTLRIPVVASWHTNLHQFAARRLERTLRRLPAAARSHLAAAVERFVLDRVLWFFSLARLTLAPNHELVSLLAARTGKPAFLMTRGIDLRAFSPAHRPADAAPFTIGCVGRLKPEKNLRFFAALESTLAAAGVAPFRFLIVGEGAEREWLRRNLQRAELPGVLTGEPLARAYASMDLFVFPSRTDTFGNVVLEALASGVPAVVSSAGGPKYIVDAQCGVVAAGDQEMADAVIRLMRAPGTLAAMRAAARRRATGFDWDGVFRSEVYPSYRLCLGEARPRSAADPLPCGEHAAS